MFTFASRDIYAETRFDPPVNKIARRPGNNRLNLSNDFQCLSKRFIQARTFNLSPVSIKSFRPVQYKIERFIGNFIVSLFFSFITLADGAFNQVKTTKLNTSLA